MKSKRRKKTLMYLITATFLSWGVCNLFASLFFPLVLFPPLVFGLALVLSNKAYLKNDFSVYIIIVSFCLIFLLGTLPFYKMGDFLFDKFTNPILASWVGVFSAFVLVAFIVKLCLGHIIIGYVQIFLMIILSLMSLLAFSILTGQKLSEFDEHTISQRLDMTVLAYQSFMSILIVSMLKNDNSII